jgi:hypothetical protein
MSLCLAGAHRTGKSTLAQAVAAELGWRFIPSRAGDVVKAMGVDLGKKTIPDVALEMQEEILKAHAFDLSAAAGEPWIADRSALDMATYATLVCLNQVHPRQASRVLGYIEACFEVANRHCSAIVLVQPGIPYVAAENKPPPDVLYQEAFNTHVWGLMSDRRLKPRQAFLRRDVLGLQERVISVVGLHRRLVVLGKAEIPEGVMVS